MLTRARRAALMAILVLAGSLAIGHDAASYPGAPWFEPSKPYRGNFPDPSIVVHHGVTYAYGTSTGGAYLPVASSTDLVTWVARPRYQPNPYNSDPFYNDALPQPATWGVDRPGGGAMPKEIWAPGVARIGSQFVAFTTVRTRISPPRYCISVATSSSPLGPFVDGTAGPLVCDADPAGSIDPQPFVDRDGVPYLLWKSEGVPGSQPTRIWSRRLAPSGTQFAAGSSRAMLLETSQPWEGNVIENPSMVRHGGRYHLFYSGNEWRSASYATGYASCSGPLGPCAKHAGNPILSVRGGAVGMGGASGFVDPDGRLMLAYHWWNAPYTEYPACAPGATCTSQGQRRMAVSPVTIGWGGPEVGGQLGRFFDVPQGSYFDDPAWWLKRTSISGGLGAPGNFGPHDVVTRAQMSAFLWRMMDRSSPNPAHGFADVPAGVYFDEPVRWLLRHGITTGWGGSSSRFSPHEPVTRAQMAAFLWRTAGAPSGSPAHGFADVPAGVYFDEPVRWLLRHGITTGWGGSSSRFSPHEPVTRAQMAAFLWRTAGAPSGSPAHGFADVPAGVYFDEPVRWLLRHGITTGWGGSSSRFSPHEPVTRAQMAAFLHRLVRSPSAWSAGVAPPATATKA